MPFDKSQMLREIRTVEDFEKWKELWKEQVVGCKDFSCCHELMSCGIVFICGECSIFSTFRKGLWEGVCEELSCMDCIKKYDCEKAR